MCNQIDELSGDTSKDFASLSVTPTWMQEIMVWNEKVENMSFYQFLPGVPTSFEENLKAKLEFWIFRKKTRQIEVSSTLLS